MQQTACQYQRIAKLTTQCHIQESGMIQRMTQGALRCFEWVSFDRSGRRAGSRRAPAGYLAKFVFVSTLDTGIQF